MLHYLKLVDVNLWHIEKQKLQGSMSILKKKTLLSKFLNNRNSHEESNVMPSPSTVSNYIVSMGNKLKCCLFKLYIILGQLWKYLDEWYGRR